MFNPLSRIRKRLARLRRFPTLARHRGATFVLDPQNWIDNRLIAGAPYETAQLANAIALIERHQLDLFLDIGANFGLYSILLGRLSSIKEVVAFEPVRRNYAQLMANVFANRLERKIDAHRLGLSDSAGDSTIHIDPLSTGVSRLDLSTADRDMSAFRETEAVMIARLDDIVRLSGRRAFIKIDVEGQAARVIAGMSDFLAANLCILQTEATTDAERAALATLCDGDYREIARIENDVIVAHRTLAG